MSTSFVVDAGDLAKILEQIKVAERNVAGESLVAIIGQDAALLPVGLRTVDGSMNHLLPGQSQAGAADEIFPRLLTPTYINEADGDQMPLGPPGSGAPTITNTNYNPTIGGSHSVADADPRIISNLIVDQTLSNRSALIAALTVVGAENPNAAADAILAARAVAVAAGVVGGSATNAAYVAADSAEANAQTKISTLLSQLTAFRDGINADNTLDQIDQDALANAASAAADAHIAQDAVVQALLADTHVSAADVSAAQSVQSGLAAIEAALNAYTLAVADGLTFQEFGDILATQRDAIQQSSAATALHTSITAGAAATSATGAAAALLQAIDNSGLELSSDGSVLIEHRSADIGLSPPNSAWMAFFGQFFDHGLDLVTKGTNGTIYIPLQPDDPLIAGADHILGNADDLPASLRFMTLSRTTGFDVNGNLSPTGTESQNTTTPFVDQNQTYTSSASHQVFLREYKFTVDSATDNDTLPDSFALNTGRLLNGVNGGIANWAEVKAQAAEKLGLLMNDLDVLDVPQLVVDAYGKFKPGTHGFAQVMVTVTETTVTGPKVTLMTVEGKAGGLDLHNITAADLVASGFVPDAGASSFTARTVGTGHAFLNDIANTAGPVAVGGVLQPDDLSIIGNAVANDGQGHNLEYDDELLNAHFITGDGRGNENIGLTAVHTIFHSEHNRLVEVNKDTIIATGDLQFVNEWLDTPLSAAQFAALNALPDAEKADAIDLLNWDGERLFQAARFVTEMQYQHLVFEEFARRIQPNVDPFVFTNSAELNPAIVAEFAHTIYRFGHSMLTDTVDRLENDLSLVNSNDIAEDDPVQITLIQAFLNPVEFTSSGADDEAATGALIRGMSRQVGNEIDEFVVEALRNNLLGLPLDLPALNIARGRDAGIPTLNNARAQIYAMTGAADVKPYTSWTDFAQHIKHPLSVINFIAAYGTHEAITLATTLEAKRAAATLLVLGDGTDADGVTINGHTYTTADRLAFLNGLDTYTHGAGVSAGLGGLNDIDLWIGGLAEELNEFGGQLGSTFNFVFEYQLEHLQNGDRFYYLSRTQGMNLLNLLEPNTFTDLVMRNTDLGDLHSTHLPGNLMSVSDMILELDTEAGQENYSGDPSRDGSNPLNRSLLDPFWEDSFLQAIDPKVLRIQGTARAGSGIDGFAHDADGKIIYDGGVLKFSGGEHVVLGGTEGNDRLIGDKGIDTLWGDGGDDYLNAGMESDQVFGGDGDDIIEDPFGDDFLRGEAGNDVIVADQGIDLLFGGEGQDFIMGVTDAKEVFAGPGNDFVLGGTAPDGLSGNEGDDWLEGGEGFDSLTGENSDLFFNSPIIGHDIMDGQGNDTDYDGESGDDIMVQGPGIQRNNGMLGFDWVIQKGDPDDGLIDLGISRFLTQQALTLRDRNDSVEGASGWKHNDTLIGTNTPVGAVGDPVGGIVGAPTTDSMLLSQNVALIRGLSEFLKLTPGALRGQVIGDDATAFSALANDVTVFDPTLGGDILLGGAGSDLIFGKAGNDLMDGDRWLNVRIEVHAVKADDVSGPSGAVLFSVDSLTSIVSGSTQADLNGKSLADLMRTGKVNPGQLLAVRELITDGATAADTDVALFAGSRADFTITRNANGTVTVVDNVVTPVLAADGTPIPLLNDEGTDTLSNFEIARFTNYDANGIPTSTFTDVSLRAPTGSVRITSAANILTADRSGIVDLDGRPANAGGYDYQWQRSEDGLGDWTNVGANSINFTVPADDTRFFRVIVSYTDGAGIIESITSQMTARVGTAAGETLNGTADPNLIIGLGGNDTLNGLGGDDVLIGGLGNDTLDGGAGNNTASYSDSTTAVTVSLAVATAQNTGAAGTDTLINIQNLTGGSAVDTLSGNAGDNILDGGAGNDNMRGGAGNDTYIVSNNNDTVDERVYSAAGVAANNSDAGGTDTVLSSAGNFVLAAPIGGAASRGSIENLTLTGAGNIDGTGNALDNVLTGNAGDNILTGAGGTDTAVFTGSATGHAYTLTAGNLTVSSTADGTDQLNTIERVQFGSSTYTTLVGTNAANTLNGTGANELIVGFNGNDTINAGAGNDVIVWGVGEGRDLVNGGAGGTDTFVVNGNGTAENFRVFSRAAALAAGLTGLDLNTDIVITRGNAVNNGNIIAELDEIEEIVINTGAGNDTVTVLGNFNPTNLSFNTITVNDGGGSDTVDATGLTSAHHIALHSSGNDDTILGARAQDEIFSDNSAPSGSNSGNSDEDDDSGNDDDNDNEDNSGSGNEDDDNSGSDDDESDDDEDTTGSDDDGSDDDEDTSGSDDDDTDDDEDTSGSDDDDTDDDEDTSGSDDEDDDDGTPAPNPGTGGNGSALPFVVYLGTALGGTGVGGALGDILSGMDHADQLFGMGGDDNMSGGGGDDYLSGDAGNDIILAGDGDDIVMAGSGNDMVFGGRGADRIWGGEGDDRIAGDEGDDVIDGGEGNDTFEARVGDGRDVYTGGCGSDTIDFQAITANLKINLGSNGTGSAESTQTGLDVLNGIENVKGGSGNDEIHASTAHNVLDGGLGNDTFVFDSAAAADGDRIEGFATGDKIDLKPFMPATLAFVADDATFGISGQVKLIFTGDDTTVQGNTDTDADTDFSFVVAGRHLTGSDFA